MLQQFLLQPAVMPLDPLRENGGGWERRGVDGRNDQREGARAIHSGDGWQQIGVPEGW